MCDRDNKKPHQREVWWLWQARETPGREQGFQHMAEYSNVLGLPGEARQGGEENSLCPAIPGSGTSFGLSLPCVCCMPRGGGAGSLANTEGNESLHTAASFTWICRSPFPCLPCFCRAGGRWHWPGGGAGAPPAWGKGRWCRRTGHRLGLEETGLEAWMEAPGQQQQEAYPEPGEGCRPGGTFENSSLKQLSEVFWV